MSNIILTNFQEGLRTSKQNIHREFFTSIVVNMKFCKLEDVIFTPPRDREFDDVLDVKDFVKNMPLEYKTDYWTRVTGNIAIELATVIPENIFPEEFKENNKIYFGYPIHSRLLDFIDKVNCGKIGKAKGSRHFLSKQLYQFCYAISKTDAFDTKSVQDIERYYVFNSFLLSLFVRTNYMYKTMIITKTENENKHGMWYTVSMLVNEKDLPKDIFFLFNSDGIRIRSSN